MRLFCQKPGSDSKNQQRKPHRVFDILKDGNTSLHTALHIAGHLNIPLSTLTGEMVPVDNPDILTILLRYFAWFDRLSKEEQKTVADHFRSIMEVVQK